MLGFVDDKDLPVLLASANLFVFPSLYEGFGYPPLEAMASGVPVVTSITSSLPEVVGNAGVMVDPFDFRKISDEMTRILKDPNVASDYSRRGLERAKCFNWKATAEATLQVFQEVIARR
jgi:glycosyltransferase involved in cell wall biosynthesis